MAENNNFPMIKFALSNTDTKPLVRRQYELAVAKLTERFVFFPEDTPALTIHNAGAYDLLITKNVDLMRSLRALNNMGYIVGIHTVEETTAMAAEETAYINAGANTVVGEFITAEKLEEVMAERNRVQ